MTGAAPQKAQPPLKVPEKARKAAARALTLPPGDQADLDRIIQDRLKRAKPADYDDLKSKAAEYDKYKESSKTEQQKAIEAARAEGAQEVTGKFTTRIVNADIRATAATLASQTRRTPSRSSGTFPRSKSPTTVRTRKRSRPASMRSPRTSPTCSRPPRVPKSSRNRNR